MSDFSPSPTPRQPSRQTERSRATRRRILDAARKTLVERGYVGASTWAICETGGFAKGTLLHHFPHKSDLFQAVITELATASLTSLDRAIEAGEPGTQLDTFMSWLWSTLDGDFFIIGLEIVTAGRVQPDLQRVTRLGSGVLENRLDVVIEALLKTAPGVNSEALRQALRASVLMVRGIGLDLATGADRAHHHQRFEEWRLAVLALGSTDGASG